MINNLCFLLVPPTRLCLGSTSHASRQFFPYVSSESDLQRYKAISFRNSSNNEPRSNSSISNIPSDMKLDRLKVNYFPFFGSSVKKLFTFCLFNFREIGTRPLIWEKRWLRYSKCTEFSSTYLFTFQKSQINRPIPFYRSSRSPQSISVK